VNNFDRSNIRNFVLWWDSQFYVDFWYRKRFSIPFNSAAHREACFIDMYIEYEEDRFLSQLRKEREEDVEDKEFYDMTGSFLKKAGTENEELTKEQEKEIYNNIDLKEMNRRDKEKKKQQGKL
jgi:hypothetical protein